MRVISVIVWQPSVSEKITIRFAAMTRGTNFMDFPPGVLLLEMSIPPG
jgi:hypothetical protein